MKPKNKGARTAYRQAKELVAKRLTELQTLLAVREAVAAPELETSWAWDHVEAMVYVEEKLSDLIAELQCFGGGEK